MKNIIFAGLLLIVCCAATSTKPLKEVETETTFVMSTVKEDVNRLVQETQQLAQFMRNLITLHESGGLAVAIKNTLVDSLSVDFGRTPISSSNKAVLRLKFRQTAQIIKNKMNKLLAIVPE